MAATLVLDTRDTDLTFTTADTLLFGSSQEIVEFPVPVLTTKVPLVNRERADGVVCAFLGPKGPKGPKGAKVESGLQ